MAALEDEKKDSPPERQNLASRKPTAAGAAPSSRPGVAPQEPAEALRCPRCDSSNTKFCYYNNYSLAQPRHFCKTCRRYWTKGGALRNVPIGGGCRKNKKLKSSSASSRLSAATFDSKLDSSSSIAGAACASSPSSASVPGFRFFQAGLSPAVDFQLGTVSSFHRLPVPYNTSFTDTPNPNSRFSLEPPFGFSNSYPSLPSSSSSPSIASGLLFSSSTTQEVGGSMNIQSSLASSIESLSSLNQDLHWKLQQQRLAMLLGTSEGNTQKDAVAAATFVSPTPSLSLDTQMVHRPQPVSFQNQEFLPIKSDNFYSRKQGESTATEWFFGNSYNSLIPDSAEDSGNGNGSAQAWNDSNLQQFGSNLS